MAETRRIAAEAARAAHRRIGDVRLRRQAPNLGVLNGVKQLVVNWCHQAAAHTGVQPWQMLGRAIVECAAERRLWFFILTEADARTASIVRQWTRWHRAHSSIGRSDLQGKLAASRVRSIWGVLLLGAVRPTSTVRSVREAGRRVGRVHPCRHREIGRWPLHQDGSLPPVRWGEGRIDSYTWISTQEDGMAERNLLAQLLRCQNGGVVSSTLSVPGAQMAREALNLKGGRMVIALHKLVHITKKYGASRSSTSALMMYKGNTLTASRSCVVVCLSLLVDGTVSVQKLSALGWATIMGVPNVDSHPLGRGLQAVSEVQGRALMGQAVHFEVACAFLRKIVAVTGWRTEGRVSYVSLFSGIDVMAAAVQHVFNDHWSFVLAADAAPLVRVALRAAWGERGVIITDNAFSEETRAYLSAGAFKADILATCFRCAPWSTANTIPLRSPERLEILARAMEEIQELLLLIRIAEPKVVIIESVCGITHPRFGSRWACIQGWLQGMTAWNWSWQIVCPSLHTGGFWPRRRLWIIGVAEGVRLAGSESMSEG